MKEKPFKSTFTAIAHCLIQEDRDKFLAKASLDELKSIIPNELTNLDGLVPIAFNLFVTNIANKNDDIVLGQDALNIYKQFIHRPINYKHQQFQPIGHITNAGFSKFNINYATAMGSELVTEEDIKKNLALPFNVAFAGVLYRVVDSELVDEIVNSADPSSDNYLEYSASFEVAFDDFKIMRGSNNIAEAEILDDEDTKEELKGSLRAFGGKGIDAKTNRRIYRLLAGEISPVGAGLLKKPGGLVKGITTAAAVIVTEKDTTASVTTENNSKIKKSGVNREEDMKQITTVAELKEIKQEGLAEVAIASVIDVVEKGIEAANETYKKQLGEKDQAIAKAQQDLSEQSKKVTDVEAKLNDVTKKLQEVEARETARANEELFQKRMSSLDETYELSKEQREVIANEIKDISEDAFKAYANKISVFAVKKAAKDADCKDGKCGTCAKCKKGKEGTAKAEDTRTPEQILADAKAKEDEQKRLANAAQTAADEQAALEKDFTLGSGIVLTK
jgi:hypothetical protein